MKNHSNLIYDLRTKYLTNPIGIDEEKPELSWKIEASKRRVVQLAYQIIVSTNNSFTENVWDSGKISSKQTIGIQYEGKKLEASTRYYWKVYCWISCDHMEEELESSVAYFETGLMGEDKTVWSDAKWIGNPKETKNTSTVDQYRFDVDFQMETGDTLGIVTNARNKDNYILFELNVKLRKLFIYEYCDHAWEKRTKHQNKEPYILLGNPEGYTLPDRVIMHGEEQERHRFELVVGGRNVEVKIDCVPILAEEIFPINPRFQPSKSYLMSVGFRQLENSVLIHKIYIQNTQDGNLYQDEEFMDDHGILSCLGEIENHYLKVKDRFELVCPVPAIHVMKETVIQKQVKSARLYTSARGFYETYIDGVNVSESYYNPGFTDYRYRIFYQTFDVTKMLTKGNHTICATITKGYYSGFCGYSGAMNYGTSNSYLAKLLIFYEDGTRECIVTDESWKCSEKGPIIDADYLDGEIYDARFETMTFHENCKVIPWPEFASPSNGTFTKQVPFRLTSQLGRLATCEQILKPISVTEKPVGHFVYDFGQNMVGTIRLHIEAKRGFSLKIRYGEMSYQDGEIYIANVRSAANTDIYTCKGERGGEVFLPTFTAHGFRYIEITGNGFTLKNPRAIQSVEGLVLNNLDEITGDFQCSNPLLNQLQSNIQWGERDNHLLVPTDCPQRNERMGWTGDAQVFARTAAFNRNVASFMMKWLQDVKDAQLMYNKEGAVPDTAPLGGDNRKIPCAGWADGAIIVPWEMYLAYGDPKFLEDNYEMMEQWISYQSMESHQNCGLRYINGVPVPEKSDLSTIPYLQLQQTRGDHLAYDETTPFIFVATAYAAYVANLISKIAQILKKKEDVKRYEKRFECIKQAFCEAWVKEDGSIGYWGEMSNSGKDRYGNIINQTYYSEESKSHSHPSQTAYALAIDFGLIPEEKRGCAGKYFVNTIQATDGHLSVGFLGISHLANALTKIGRNDIAYQLLLKQDNPSWLYSVVNGATTIWERWNSYIKETDTFGDVTMNSFNHYSYGAIGEWMYQNILGIRTGEAAGNAGYRIIYLTPTIGGDLSYASGWHESPYGRIESGWNLLKNQCEYRCKIPVGTKAYLFLPILIHRLREELQIINLHKIHILENGKPLEQSIGVKLLNERESSEIAKYLSYSEEYEINEVLEIESGTYEFQIF